jgi:hypothetical protein
MNYQDFKAHTEALVKDCTTQGLKKHPEDKTLYEIMETIICDYAEIWWKEIGNPEEILSTEYISFKFKAVEKVYEYMNAKNTNRLN